MGRAAACIAGAGFDQAQMTVDGEANFGRVGVILTIILPPADGAKGHCVGSVERPIAAAEATKAGFRKFHTWIDARPGRCDDIRD